jgi:protein TonB
MTASPSSLAESAARFAVPPAAMPRAPQRGSGRIDPTRRDDLTRGQLRLVVGAILAAHVAAVWGLLQLREVRDAVAAAAPLFVSLVAPEKPAEPAPPPPPVPQPSPRRLPPPAVIAAEPSPAPAPFVVAAPPPEPEAPAPAVVAMTAAPQAVPPAPAPQPRIIPASAVQYLEPIALEYPRMAKRLGEAGRVLIRVFIDEVGLAKNAQVNRSSGHSRLDDAALAAVQKARFKPYMENGAPVAGWAFIPLEFELEK